MCDLSVRVQEAPTLPGMVASGGCAWGRRESVPWSLLQPTPRIRPGPPFYPSLPCRAPPAPFSTAWVQQNRLPREVPNSFSPSLALGREAGNMEFHPQEPEGLSIHTAGIKTSKYREYYDCLGRCQRPWVHRGTQQGLNNCIKYINGEGCKPLR